jgi:hypothetical protein
MGGTGAVMLAAKVSLSGHHAPILTHPGWKPAEVLPTEKAREFLKGSVPRMFGPRPRATPPTPPAARPDAHAA